MIDNINNSKLLIFVDLSIFFLGLFSFFPFIRAISFFNILWPVLLMILVVSMFLTSKRSRTLKPSRLTFFIVFYIIYTVGVSFLSGNLSIANRFIELIFNYNIWIFRKFCFYIFSYDIFMFFLIKKFFLF